MPKPPAKLVLAATATLLFSPAALASDGFVVHEWGYFVENGTKDPVEILSSMPSEVPDFRTTSAIAGRFRLLGPGRSGSSSSSTAPSMAISNAIQPFGSPRNQTPAPSVADRFQATERSTSTEPYIYFYSDRARTVGVKVRFADGRPLFWWPTAMVDESSLEWSRVNVLPRGTRPKLHDWSGKTALRLGLDRAREVDSSPVKVQNRTDKYLFYEGTMSTDTILGRYLSWDGHHLVNLTAEPLHDLLVFAPGSDRPCWIATLRPREEAIVPDGYEGEDAIGPEDLASIMEGAGLFADEAKVMADSVWRTGFLHATGTRVLYRIPRETYDRIYPLEIAPAPDSTVRVGLVLSFDLDQAIEAALDKLGGTYLRHAPVRETLLAQLRDIVGSRISNLEPLTESMKRALALDDPAMVLLRRKVERPAARQALSDIVSLDGEAQRLARIDAGLAWLDASVRTRSRASGEARETDAERFERYARLANGLGELPLSAEATRRMEEAWRGIEAIDASQRTVGSLTAMIRIAESDLLEARKRVSPGLADRLAPHLYAGTELSPSISSLLRSRIPRGLATTVSVPVELIR